jgi:hypothetical protein
MFFRKKKMEEQDAKKLSISGRFWNFVKRYVGRRI